MLSNGSVAPHCHAPVTLPVSLQNDIVLFLFLLYAGRMKSGSIALALGLLLAGCGSQVATSITGSRTPTDQDPIRFESVAIMTVGSKPEDTRAIEDAAIERFSKRGVRAVGSFELAPSIQDIASKAWITAVLDAELDAMMYILLENVDLQRYWVPRVYHPGSVTGTVTDDSVGTQITIRQDPGYFTGGYRSVRATGTYILALYDVSGARKVWAGQAIAQGDTKNTMRDLGRSAARKAVDRLFEEAAF